MQPFTKFPIVSSVHIHYLKTIRNYEAGDKLRQIYKTLVVGLIVFGVPVGCPGRVVDWLVSGVVYLVPGVVCVCARVVGRKCPVLSLMLTHTKVFFIKDHVS